MKEQLIKWLKDAYAMEAGIMKVLEAHSADARKEGFDEVADKIEEHLEETKSQAERVKECLQNLDSDTSAGRDFLSQAGGAGHALSGKMFDDEIIKAAVSDYGTEYFEVASYQAIVAAAEACGEDEVASVCREIMEEERAMGEWLGDHISRLVEQYLEKNEAAA